MMHRLLVLTLGLSLTLPLGSQQITFKHWVVNTGNLRLGDLVEYQEGLENYLFLPIRLSEESIWVLCPRWVMSQVGLPESTNFVVARILVVPAKWDIPSALITELGKWMNDQNSGPNFVVELRDVKLLDPLPLGVQTYQLSRISGEKTFNIPNGYWVWRINPAQSSSRIRALVQVHVPVLRLQKTMGRGASLTAETYRIEYLPLNQFFRRPMTVDDLSARWILAQPVRSGEILYTYQVQPVYDVNAQTGIRVVVQRAGIRVEINGVSLDGGNIGDRIRIRLNDSGRSLRALVTAEGEVHVENL